MSEPVVELEAPDISDWVGNTGVPYVTTLDSGVPGPDAMINAVIHGNVRSSACFRSALLRLRLRLSLTFDASRRRSAARSRSI